MVASKLVVIGHPSSLGRSKEYNFQWPIRHGKNQISVAAGTPPRRSKPQSNPCQPEPNANACARPCHHGMRIVLLIADTLPFYFELRFAAGARR
jgi:hypothetical protein